MSEQVTREGMLCPVCGLVLVMAERHGIEIDYCPKCRGVWLDRGELDKIIEHAALDLRALAATPYSAAISQFGAGRISPCGVAWHRAWPRVPALLRRGRRLYP